MRSRETLDALLRRISVGRVLDIGSGDGSYATVMRDAGLDVTTISYTPPADIVGDYLALTLPNRYDAIWACHVLEHCPNPGLFLSKCFADLVDGGWLAVTVPPRKDEIVGGHVTLWNAGLLLYQLILAGFDCRDAAIKTYGYNISVIVRKKRAVLPALVMDSGDIERLAEFFPMPVQQEFNGVIEAVNWS